ncbi:MAG: ABC transporter substrate-binding protein [Bryobacteraceae bacterium]|nr:ABC transporter substrate-binding protein [Bryobacteraceae bacterium]
MREICRHLWLAAALILLASGSLLLSDLRHRQAPDDRLRRVAIFQIASRPIMDDGVDGVLTGLRAKGHAAGETISIQRFNAENDLPTANSIARNIVDQGFDMAITVSTPCLQAMAAANAEGKVIHAFGLVTDPFNSGVGLNRDAPDRHPRHLVGIGTFQPVREALRLTRQSYPALRRVGLVWNPAEACSEACTRIARATCAEFGLNLMEANAENPTAVAEAANSLVARGAEVLFVGGDNTVDMAIRSVIQAGAQGRIPVVTTVPTNAEIGALMGLGADYFEVGRALGELAGDVLNGRDPASIPIEDKLPKRLGVNAQVQLRLRDPWRMPPDVLAAAALGVDESGRRWEKQRDAASPPPAKAD